MDKSLARVQHELDLYDTEFWEHSPGVETIRHCLLHLVKLNGKVATFSEAAEHGAVPSLEQIDTEVIPDLLMFAARLANDRGIDLAAAFDARLAELRARRS